MKINLISIIKRSLSIYSIYMIAKLLVPEVECPAKAPSATLLRLRVGAGSVLKFSNL